MKFEELWKKHHTFSSNNPEDYEEYLEEVKIHSFRVIYNNERAKQFLKFNYKTKKENKKNG